MAEENTEIENSEELEEHSVEIETSNNPEAISEAKGTEDIEISNGSKGSSENGASDEIENQNITYNLKILNGPHVGAEVSLSDKIWVVGRSDTCDIALLDETLKEQHAKFSLKDGKVFCEPFEGAMVSVDGFTLDGPTELKKYQSILCGKTLLSVGPSNEAWPEISLKEVKAEEKKETQSEIEASKEVQEEVKKSKEKSSHFPFFTKLKEIIFSLRIWLIVVFIALGVFFVFRSNEQTISEPEQKSFPIVSLKASIEKVLEEFGVEPSLIKLGLSGKMFTLQCYVGTLVTKKELQDKLRALPNVTFQSLRIFAQQSFLEQTQEALKSLQTVQVVAAARPDTLILKGYLYDMEQLPTIKSRLFYDIMGLNALETSLLSQDDVYKLASNLLTQYNLMGLLKIQPMKAGIMVTGNIQASDEPYWKDARKALKRTFDSICKVLTYVAVVAPSAVKKLFFPSPIIGVSIPNDEPGWIDLKDGGRYYEGTLLDSGYILQSISPEGIRLQKNEDSIFFALEEL